MELWERIGSRNKKGRVKLSAYGRTTLNIGGPTMLGVLASVLAVVYKRMQELPTLILGSLRYGDYGLASLSLKAGELKAFLRKDEILELPRRQNASKIFSVVATTRNGSTTHRSRRTTREKWTVTWFWSCAVACLSVVVVCSGGILNSLLLGPAVHRGKDTSHNARAWSRGCNISELKQRRRRRQRERQKKKKKQLV